MYFTKLIMKCFYCNSTEHKLNDCHVDNELDNIIYSTKLPNFNTLNIKILKKIASLQGIPYNTQKNILIKKLYEKYNEIHNKQNNITIETTAYVNGDRIICINEKCEGTIINIEYVNQESIYTVITNENKKIKCNISNIELNPKYNNLYELKQNKECPICLETIHNADMCTTLCNHTFHLSCLLQLNDNKCPICRTIIPHKSKTVEYDYILQNNIPRIGAHDENDDITANNMIYSILSNTDGMISYT